MQDINICCSFHIAIKLQKFTFKSVNMETKIKSIGSQSAVTGKHSSVNGVWVPCLQA